LDPADLPVGRLRIVGRLPAPPERDRRSRPAGFLAQVDGDQAAVQRQLHGVRTTRPDRQLVDPPGNATARGT